MTTVTLLDELTSRGTDRPYATQLVSRYDAQRIVEAVAYFDAQPEPKLPGLLVLAIREGRKPRAEPASVQERQEAYGEEIVDWLRKDLPQVCRPNLKVVEVHRQAFGDVEADRLASDRSPHPAAVACVIRLHARVGKGRVTKREHGSEILGCVEASDREAIVDYEQIAAKREALQV